VALRRAEEVLRRNGHNTVLIPTTGPSTAGGIARRAIAEGAGLIVVAGGDGTVNEALDGMVHTPVPLGILPLGTANVLANELGLPAGLEEAAEALAACRPERISVGMVRFAGDRPRHFLLMAGAGLDARVVSHVNRSLKARLGKLAYWIASLNLAGRALEEFAVQAEGAAFEASFALVSKVRNYGGDFEIARNVTLLDDRFEVVLFAGRSFARYGKYLLGVALKRAAGMRGVTVLRASRVELSAPAGRRVHVQVDGELAGCLPATLEIVPDALTLLVPPAYAQRAGDARRRS
jgi:YegS/Rv2252/BmrU family lipid kinase